MSDRAWHPTSAERKRAPLLGVLSWSTVRGLGELQVLTRASYVMLVLVPLLAGVWPALQATISRWGGLPESPNAAGPAAGSVPEAAILMPEGWAVAFFAALSATLAHLIYQPSAPDLVRLERREAFQQRRREEYARQPTPGQYGAAAYALGLLGSSSSEEIIFAIAQDLHRSDPDPNATYPNFRRAVRDKLVLLSAAERETLRLSLARKDLLLFEEFSKGIDNPEPIGRLAFELDIVSRAAAVTYDTEARRGPVAIAMVGILYGLALGLILWLTYTQSRAVALATGWPWPF